MTKRIDPTELVGLVEVATILGMARSNVRARRARGLMPDPIVELANGPLWLISQIHELADEMGRRPRKLRARR